MERIIRRRYDVLIIAIVLHLTACEPMNRSGVSKSADTQPSTYSRPQALSNTTGQFTTEHRTDARSSERSMQAPPHDFVQLEGTALAENEHQESRYTQATDGTNEPDQIQPDKVLASREFQVKKNVEEIANKERRETKITPENNASSHPATGEKNPGPISSTKAPEKLTGDTKKYAKKSTEDSAKIAQQKPYSKKSDREPADTDRSPFGEGARDWPCATAKECKKKGLGISTGTGFLITEDGYLITNKHVVADAKKLYVVLNGQTYRAKVLESSEKKDLALLKIQSSSNPYLKVRFAPPRKGSAVTAMGYPNIGVMGNELKATFGHINAMSGPKGDPLYMQFSAEIQPGNSGGPVLDDAGRVVGIVSATLSQGIALSTTGTLAQGVNYAIKVEYAVRLLSKTPKFKFSSGLVQTLDTAELVDVTEEAVALIVNFHKGGSEVQARRQRSGSDTNGTRRSVPESIAKGNNFNSRQEGEGAGTGTSPNVSLGGGDGTAGSATHPDIFLGAGSIGIDGTRSGEEREGSPATGEDKKGEHSQYIYQQRESERDN